MAEHEHSRRIVALLALCLVVRGTKTDASERVVDLTPAVRDEVANYLGGLPEKQPTDLFLPTHTG
jgi:hypothetical protein